MELDKMRPSVAGKLLPLSLSQREVWLDQVAWPGSCHLNIGGCGFLVGPLDVPLYREALRLLVAETEALRLVPLADGTQLLLDCFEPELAMLDLGQSEDPAQSMRQWWQRQIRQPFPDDGRPPWRFFLLRGNDRFHGVTIQFHHLVMDGWGTTRIARRWSAIYNALAAGWSVAPDESPPYQQFIEESLAYRRSPAFSSDAQYWLAQLQDLPPPLFEQRYPVLRDSLPTAHVRTQPVPRADYDQLCRFAGERRLTAFAVILTATALYFARTRNRSQVVIGVPSLNRGGNRYLATPGMFVGILPIAIAVDLGVPAGDMTAAVNRQIREALRHPGYPLSELSRHLQAIPSGRDGLFEVVLSFERQDYAVAFGDTSLVESRQLFSGVARYPLGVTVCEFHPEQDLELIMEGSAACFEGGDLELLGRRLLHLVDALMRSPERPVGEIPLVPEEERWALVNGIHQGGTAHNSPQPFVAIFQHHAALRPDAVALVWDGGAMSYGELDRRASRLAQTLLAAQAAPHRVIAMALDRSPEMVEAMLAVAKAGSAFLPLDPDAPPDRLRDIIDESGSPILLVQARNRDRLASLHPQVLVVDADPTDLREAAAIPLAFPAPEDLAYVLFTSGSTGRPKGVMIDHGTLARRLAWLSGAYQVSWSDRSCQATQYTFDPALIEICLPLINGASVALPPPGRLPAKVLVDFARDHSVTIMAFVPSTLQSFLDALNGRSDLKLRVACCGGEVLPAELANRFLRETGARLYNVYGPTEAAIFATALACAPSADDLPLAIGRPIDDTRIYVLDDRLQPVPFGEPGEIYIGGRALGRGYLNRPDLDEAAFLGDPFHPGDRMYRSGDSGWLGCDGNLHFLGRRDRQIKLRGYRIELGEIEAVLQSAGGVHRAAAKLLAEGGRHYIHAWAAAGGGLDPARLRQHLQARLPDYMLPADITILQSLPETATGKINYEALRQPSVMRRSIPARQPCSDLEWEILATWQGVLGKKISGVTDNFFALGGDSLAAIDVLVGLERRLGRKFPLHLLTENPTIESLARAVGVTEGTTRPILRLGGQSGRPPLYLAASGHGDLLRFKVLAEALGQEFDVFMLQPPDAAAMPTMRDLGNLYADLIADRTAPAGYLAGFSVGGIAALEAARSLQDRGLAVSGLVLIDTVYPSAILRAKKLWSLLSWVTRLLHVQELSMNGRRLEAMFSDAGLLAQVGALGAYSPVPYSGDAVLIKSTGLSKWQRWLFRPWRRLLADHLMETETPGLHGSLFEPANAKALAAILISIAAASRGADR